MSADYCTHDTNNFIKKQQHLVIVNEMKEIGLIFFFTRIVISVLKVEIFVAPYYVFY